MPTHKNYNSIDFYQSQQGFISNRDTLQGSIFIQELCNELKDQWFILDINTMAANVNRRIMENYGQIQAPIFENQLGNLVWFNAGFLNR